MNAVFNALWNSALQAAVVFYELISFASSKKKSTAKKTLTIIITFSDAVLGLPACAANYTSTVKGPFIFTEDSTVTTSASGAYGLYTVDGTSITSTGMVSVRTTGQGAGGINATGGTINLVDADVTTTKRFAGGLLASNSGVNISTINSTGDITVHIAGDNASAIRVGSSGQMNLNNVNLTTAGISSNGLYATGSGSITINGATVIHTAGNNSPGVYVSKGLLSTQRGNIILETVDISTTGNNSSGMLAEGGATIIDVNGGSISTTGTNSHGFAVLDGASKTFDGQTDGILPSVTVSGDGSAVVASTGINSQLIISGNTALAMSNTTGVNTWGGKAEKGGELTLQGNSSTGGTRLWVADSSSLLTLIENADAAGSLVMLDDGALHIGNSNQIGSLLGSVGSVVSAIPQNGSLKLGNNNITNDGSLIDNANFAGTFTQIGQLTKTGTLSQILSGTGNTVGSVNVTGGTLKFEQTGTFATSGSYATQSGATTDIGIGDSGLAVGDVFAQLSGATLRVVLDDSQPLITAKSAELDGLLLLNGFVMKDLPAKASAMTSNLYTLIHTTDGITGNFTNYDSAQPDLDYLLRDGHISADRKDYNLGVRLAWTDGGKTQGTGQFTLVSGTAFDMDIPLVDQTVPPGGFDNGWDGKSLTKAGLGELTLSAINTYTGDTLINGGTLRTGITNAFAASANITVASGATLDLNGFNQLANNLSGAGGVTLGNAALTANANAATTFSGVLSGTGALIKTGAATLTLSGTNTFSGGTTINAGTLQIGDGGMTGSITGDVTNSGTLAFNRSDLSTFANVISGTGGVDQIGGGTTVLSGANTYSGGTTISGGTLQVSTDSNLGDAAGGLNFDGGTLVTTASFNSARGATLTANGGTVEVGATTTLSLGGVMDGMGALTKMDTGTLMLTGENTYRGGTTISGGTLQLGDGGTTGSVQDGIAVANGATLALARGGAYTLGNTLSGSGLMTVNTVGQSFDFATAATGSGFGGTVALQNTTFNLEGMNTTALTNATLRLDSGSVTTVADGPQSIQGLTINGGRVIFNATVPAQTQATSLIEANALDVSSTGTVQVSVPVGYVPATPTPSDDLSLLQQDDINVGTRLVTASTVLGSGGALTLVDQNGQVISAGQSIDVQQGGKLVAVGTYDYGLTTGTNQDGLYVNYGLKQLDLQAGQSLSLTENTGATGSNADLAARLTGAGNLVIAADNTLSLSNTTNDFSGTTTVQSGTLQANATNVIAHSSAVTVDAGTTLDTNGFDQSLTNLSGAGTVTNGTATATTLTLNDTAPSTFSGSITGAQLALVQASGTQVLSGTNRYGGGTTVNNGATLQLGAGGTAGSITGDVTNDGALVFNRSDTNTFAGVISGTGAVNQIGSGTTVLTGNNTYAGGTALRNGRLNLGHNKALGTGELAMDDNTTLGFSVDGLTIANAIRLTGNNDPVIDTGAFSAILSGAISGGGFITKQGSGTLTFSGANTYTGATDVAQGTLKAGSANTFSASSAHSVAAGATLDLAGYNQTVSGLKNAGTVSFGTGTAPGTALTVRGDYVGDNGQIILDTVFGNDKSATDKLVLDGGRASGSTALVVKHASGDGAQTNQGIAVVQTLNGGSTDTTAFALSAASDGYRQGVGTLASGAYDYSLKRGGNGGVADDWYLVSAGNKCSTNTALCAQEPTTRQLRPEVGAYLNNKLAASTLQIHTLHDREYQAPGMQAQDRDDGTDEPSWVRVVGTTSSRTGAGNLDLSDNSYLIHFGTDVARFDLGDKGSLRVGVMGAYGTSSNHADNGDLSASGSVKGYSAGVYGTWYGSQDIQLGPYVDSWVMYGKFNNTVNGQGLREEDYKSSNLAASLEGGYSFPIYESQNTRIFVEPQAQVIQSNFHGDGLTEHNGTVVSGQSDTSMTTRVGVRVHGNIDDDKGLTQMRPFAEVNWWHGPGSQSITFDGTTVNDSLPNNRIESKVGLQNNLSKSVSVSGSVGFEMGPDNYTEATAQVAFKYCW